MGSSLYLGKVLFGCCKQTGVDVFFLSIVKYWHRLESHNRIGFVVVIIAIVAIIISLAVIILNILF